MRFFLCCSHIWVFGYWVSQGLTDTKQTACFTDRAGILCFSDLIPNFTGEFYSFYGCSPKPNIYTDRDYVVITKRWPNHSSVANLLVPFGRLFALQGLIIFGVYLVFIHYAFSLNDNFGHIEFYW